MPGSGKSSVSAGENTKSNPERREAVGNRRPPATRDFFCTAQRKTTSRALLKPSGAANVEKTEGLRWHILQRLPHGAGAIPFPHGASPSSRKPRSRQEEERQRSMISWRLRRRGPVRRSRDRADCVCRRKGR